MSANDPTKRAETISSLNATLGSKKASPASGSGPGKAGASPKTQVTPLMKAAPPPKPANDKGEKDPPRAQGLWERINDKFTAILPKKLPDKKSVAIVLQQMAVMLESGVPILEVFNALLKQVDDPALTAVIKDMDTKVTRMGWKMSRVMKEYPSVFPAYCAMFVQAGETTGDLSSRLKRAGLLLEREAVLINQVRSALTSPALTLAVAGIVLFACVKFVMPRFVEMYQGMNIELPAITQFVMAVVEFLNHPSFLVALVAIVLIWRWKRDPISEWLFTKLVHTPRVSRWIGTVLCAQFCDVLGSLLKEGVTIVKAVHMIAETAPYKTHREYLYRVHKMLVEEGDFAHAIVIIPYFPKMLYSMSTVGQEVGSIDSMLESLNRILEQEVDTTITQVLNLIEPLMICGLGIITAFFFVGMFLPVYGMLSSLGG